MTTLLTPEVVAALTAGHLAHLVTINPDGSPQATIIWVGVEDDEIVSGHLPLNQKLRNVERDPRVSISMQLPGRNAWGLDHYLVVEGSARVTEGGAPELLQRLAHVYLGPDVTFPGMPNPPSGYVLRTTPTKVRGVLPWESRS
jgi:PPOX class probable F420-dependent enzyme